MTPSNRNVLVVNVAYWVVAALLHPLASLLPSESGQTPRIFSLLIPLVFIGLASGSTYMIARAMRQPKGQ
ncbi:hypothetical protein [Humisphaera borealis]|uniref:Uncharacterized protein n=1 Tax=Humisphaera borealis TaxID=2807512 RepID=A0A7M2WVT2_9BACT|nr:hypothetical protein [Humisphaera borealis]QOV88590.1 hypothetical protein IPV69_20450 [Humisphaera borealis]